MSFSTIEKPNTICCVPKENEPCPPSNREKRNCTIPTSCLRKLDKRPAVFCPDTGKMWLQGYEPRNCCSGTVGRRFVCRFFLCEKCKQAFETCQELKKHCRQMHCVDRTPYCCPP